MLLLLQTEPCSVYVGHLPKRLNWSRCRLKGRLTYRSFCYAPPCLWNQLPLSLRQPHYDSGTSSSISDSPIPSSVTSSSFYSPLRSSINPYLTFGLNPTCFTNPPPRSFTSFSRTAFTVYCPDRFFWATRFLFLVFLYCFVSVPCARLSWPSRHLLSARKYTISYRILDSGGPNSQGTVC